MLCRLLPLLRQAFPQARFLVRLDGGFATPEIFDYLDAEPRLDYVVAMAKNAVLQRHAEPALLVAQAQSAASGQTAHVYADTRYRARTWDRDRRVVIKAEVVRLGDREPRDNPRFVVTNLRQTPRFVHERIYCARGDIENQLLSRRRPTAAMLGVPCARRSHRPRGRLWAFSRVEGRRVAGRGRWLIRELSQPGRRPIPVGTFPPPALRTRRADFRHRALQWNHAARTRVPGHDQRAGSREPWHHARTLAPVWPVRRQAC